MKLLADLNIAPRTVSALRAKGYDVVRAADARATDAAIVEQALREGRALR